MQAAQEKVGNIVKPIVANKILLCALLAAHVVLLLILVAIGGSIFNGLRTAGPALAADIFRYAGCIVALIITIGLIAQVVLGKKMKIACIIELAAGLCITLGWWLDANSARVLADPSVYPGVPQSNYQALAITATIFGVLCMFSTLIVVVLAYIYNVQDAEESTTKAVEVPAPPATTEQ